MQRYVQSAAGHTPDLEVGEIIEIEADLIAFVTGFGQPASERTDPMTNLEEVQANIGQAITHCESAIDGTQTVRAATTDTLAAAYAATQGTRNPKVTEGLARLDEARRETERVLRLLHASIGAAHTYQRTLR